MINMLFSEKLLGQLKIVKGMYLSKAQKCLLFLHKTVLDI